MFPGVMLPRHISKYNEIVICKKNSRQLATRNANSYLVTILNSVSYLSLNIQ